ncbi:MAG: hypothetical protein KAW92_13215 [Candidatus Cloacimonetes bacterium]|nr:hypothetical protein [Candidatus Cloacimonadota bacterium]
MKRIYLIFVIWILLFVFGCGPTSFVVLRDVPLNPSMVVVPVNPLAYQVEFANDIEEIIIGSGVRVLQRPTTKEITVTKEAEKVDIQMLQSGKAEMSMVERFYAFDEITADYIVITNSYSNQVRIIKNDTQEVLASFKTSREPANLKIKIKNALRGIGLVIRE